MNRAVEEMNRTKADIDSLIALCDNTLASQPTEPQPHER